MNLMKYIALICGITLLVVITLGVVSCVIVGFIEIFTDIKEQMKAERKERKDLI